ncbi:hypothetical protein AB3N04_16500 [Alkalihalophilus sp. As8PL]|uniref:Uncharacterized protein n=2 Tax=Alkalihalophilus TaxID=2893060 RepID=A0AB39BS34_9BACI|nr:hypothetical protein [Alkalihalophilus lindianensis]MDV2685007.1 hypothetical protein [Alkalihalophilus lindianensis]
MSKHSRSKRAIQQGKDAVQPANETEGLTSMKSKEQSQERNQQRGDR